MARNIKQAITKGRRLMVFHPGMKLTEQDKTELQRISGGRLGDLIDYAFFVDIQTGINAEKAKRQRASDY